MKVEEIFKLSVAIAEFTKANPELPVGLIYSLNRTLQSMRPVKEALDETRNSLIKKYKLEGVEFANPGKKEKEIKQFVEEMNIASSKDEDITIGTYAYSDLEKAGVKTLKMSNLQELIFEYVII